MWNQTITKVKLNTVLIKMLRYLIPKKIIRRFESLPRLTNKSVTTFIPPGEYGSKALQLIDCLVKQV